MAGTYFVTDEASGEVEIMLCSGPAEAAAEMCRGYSADSDPSTFTVRDEDGNVVGRYAGRAVITWRMESIVASVPSDLLLPVCAALDAVLDQLRRRDLAVPSAVPSGDPTRAVRGEEGTGKPG